MAISDKNRKILWARSGNRCAICRVVLAVERTAHDSESVVGAECHICSHSPNGPRYESKFSPEQCDSLENFILLCATHHKMIDDQAETYTPEVVRSIRSNHEKWVDCKLRDEPALPEVRVRRFQKNIPKNLPRITSGKKLLDIAANAVGHYFDHEDNLSDLEAELVGRFAQELADMVDLGADLQPFDQVRFAGHMQGLLDELEQNGFYVFVGRELQQLEGGVGTPSAWPVLHISVLRLNNPAIQPATEQG